MARRQGLLFQPPDQMNRVLVAQRNNLATASLYRPSTTSKSKKKESGLSTAAKIATTANLAYKGFDYLNPTDANAKTGATGLVNKISDKLSPLPQEIKDYANVAEGVKDISSGLKAEALSEGATAAANVAEGVTQGVNAAESSNLAAGGSSSSLGTELMEAGSQAWGAVSSAYNSLITYLSDRRLKNSILYLEDM